MKQYLFKHRHQLPVYPQQSVKGLSLLQPQLFWALVWSLHIKMDETFWKIQYESCPGRTATGLKKHGEWDVVRKLA